MIIVNGYIIVIGGNGVLVKIDPKSGNIVKKWGHYGTFDSQMGVTPAGHIVICSLIGEHTTVRLVDPDGSSLRVINLPKSPKLSTTVLLNGYIAIFFNVDEPYIQIFNPMTGELVQEIFYTGNAHGQMLALANGYLALSSVDTIKIFNPSTGEHIRDISTEGVIHKIVLAPNGNIVACIGAEGTIRLINPETGEAMRIPLLQIGTASSMTILPNGHLIAASSILDELPLRVFNIETGELVRIIPSVKWAFSIETMADGNIAVHSYKDANVWIFNPTDGRLINTVIASSFQWPALEVPPPHFGPPIASPRSSAKSEASATSLEGGLEETEEELNYYDMIVKLALEKRLLSAPEEAFLSRYRCALTHQIMQDPVYDRGARGEARSERFERTSIEHYIELNKSRVIDSGTRVPPRAENLMSDEALKEEIAGFIGEVCERFSQVSTGLRV